MRLGQHVLEALQAQIRGKLSPGDELVAAGVTGNYGTIQLIKHEKDKLREYFSESFLRMSMDTMRSCVIFREDEIWKDERITALFFTEEGGVLCGLWKLAEASGVGLDVDLRKIPIRQETIEICERLDVDPYKLMAGGMALLGTKEGDTLVTALRKKGMQASVIGHAEKGNGRLLHSGDVTRYLDRPSQDELTKFTWGESWKSEGKIPGISLNFSRKDR